MRVESQVRGSRKSKGEQRCGTIPMSVDIRALILYESVELQSKFPI